MSEITLLDAFRIVGPYIATFLCGFIIGRNATE